MIRLIPPDEPLSCPDPLSCRIETLRDCYGTLPDLIGTDCYRSERGGVLCRFGTSLLLAGSCDGEELAQFAALLGITRIEGAGDCFSPPAGWEVEQYPLLTLSPASHTEQLSFCAKRPVAPSDRLRRVFALLCESDPQFRETSDPLYWLSDLTRRCNRGRAEVYLLEEEATACLSAIGGGWAYLSSVAVSPEHRGRGLALRLLCAIDADCAARGLTLITAAQSTGLVPFYRRAGFSPLGRELLIATMS